MSKTGVAIVKRARKKIGRTLNRMLSVLVKKSPLTEGDFDELIVSATGAEHLNDYIRNTLRRRRVVIADSTDSLFSHLGENYPVQRREIVSSANHVLDNRIRLLGFDPHTFDGKFEWYRDFVSGVSWRNDYYLSVPVIMWENKSDIKVPWELSRCHYLVWLAQAFRFTNDDRYARKIVELVESWIESNPYPYGPNWTCAMEVAIRMLNWITTLEIVGECGAMNEAFYRSAYLSLFQHAVYIEENLEKIGNGLSTNHYLADLLGMLAAGSLFRELPQGERWLNFARCELEQEIIAQTLPDGFCHESSLSYHMLTLEMYLLALAIESHHGGFSEDYRQRLRKMVHLAWALTKPDGTLPNLGDGDSGRILILDGNPEQKSSRLTDLAACLLKNADHRFEHGRPPYEAILISGLDSVRATVEACESTTYPLEHSCHFESSGLACMRKNELFLFFAANPIGSGGLGGHKHNDMLAIEISCGETNFVIDSGTYTYTSDQIARNSFRATESHSVPAVRGVEQNRFLPKLLFAIRSDAQVRVTKWESTEDHDLVEAEHSGYTKLQDPLLVLRKIYFDKEHELWILCDSLYGRGTYDFENTLIIGDAVPETVEDASVLLRSSKSSETLEICNFSSQWRPSLRDHSVSQSYGQRTNTRKLVYTFSGDAPQSMIWAALPNADLERDRKIEVARKRAGELGWTEYGDIRGALSTAPIPEASVGHSFATA